MAATTVDSLVQRLVDDNTARRRALEDEVVASKRHNAYLEETLVALQRTAQRQETDLAAARAANTVLRGGDEALALQRSIQDLRGLLEQRNAELSTLQAALRRAQEEPELRGDAHQPAALGSADMGSRASLPLAAPDAAAHESVVRMDALASFADEGDEPEVSLRLCPAAGPRRWSGGAHPQDSWVAHSDDRTAAGEAEAHAELDSVMSPRAPARRQHAAHHRLSEDDAPPAPRQVHRLQTGPLLASSSYSGVDGKHVMATPSPAFFAPSSTPVAAAATRPMSPRQRSSSPRFNGGSSTGSGDGFWRAATHAAPMEPSQPPPAFAPGATRVALLMRPTPSSLQWVRAGTRPPLLPPPSATSAAPDSRRGAAPEPHLPFKSGAPTPTPIQSSPRQPGVGGSGTGFGISQDRPLSASWAGSNSRHAVPATEIEQRHYAVASPAAQALRGGPAGASQENPSQSATLSNFSSRQEQPQQRSAAPPVILSASSLQAASSPAFRRGDPVMPQPQAALPGTPQHVPSPSSRPAKPQPPGQPQSLRSQYPGATATAASPARPVLPQSVSLPPPHAFSLASRSPPPSVPPAPFESPAPVLPGSSGHAGARAATTTLPTLNDSPATDADSASTAAAAERVQASIRQLTLELEQLRGGHREGGGGISTGGSSGRSAAGGGPLSPAFPRSPPPPQAAASARSAAPTAAAAVAAAVPKRPSWQDTLRHLDAAISGRQ